VVVRAPLNVEDPVGRGSTSRSKDAQVGASVGGAGAGALIRPIGADRVGGCSYWYAAYIEAVVNRPEGQVAIGANGHIVEACVIQRVREGKGNDRMAVVDVVAGIGRP